MEVAVDTRWRSLKTSSGSDGNHPASSLDKLRTVSQ